MKENSKSKTGFIIGLIAAVLILTTPNPESLPIEAQRAAAIFVWMAIWWATEAVHIAITALIPLVFFSFTWCCLNRRNLCTLCK